MKKKVAKKKQSRLKQKKNSFDLKPKSLQILLFLQTRISEDMSKLYIDTSADSSFVALTAAIAGANVEIISDQPAPSGAAVRTFYDVNMMLYILFHLPGCFIDTWLDFQGR